MFLKNAAPLMTALALCMMIPSARAQAPAQDGQDVRTDQQAVQNAYQQLQRDRQSGNAAAVATDESNLNTAKINLQNARQTYRTANQNSPDGQAVRADQQAVQSDYLQLQRDRQSGNAAAVATDESTLNIAKTNLQTARQADRTANGNVAEGTGQHRRHYRRLDRDGNAMGNQNRQNGVPDNRDNQLNPPSNNILGGQGGAVPVAPITPAASVAPIATPTAMQAAPAAHK